MMAFVNNYQAKRKTTWQPAGTRRKYRKVLLERLMDAMPTEELRMKVWRLCAVQVNSLKGTSAKQIVVTLAQQAPEEPVVFRVTSVGFPDQTLVTQLVMVL